MISKYLLSFVIILRLNGRVWCLYEQCNHVLNLNAGQKIYINSPYYPNKYPVGTSCRYTVKAPQNYKLSFKCNINLKVPVGATRCYNEVFYFNSEGSELLTNSEYFCGSGVMERKSLFNRAVISYISTPSSLYKTSGKEAADNDGKIEEVEIEKGTSKEIKITSTGATTTTTADEDSEEHATTTGPMTFGNLSSNQDVVNASGMASPKEDAIWLNVTLVHGDASAEKRARIVINESGAGLIAGSTPNFMYYREGGGTFSCLVEVLAASCDCGWSMSSTKVAGISTEAGINEFPAMAGVLTVKYNRIFCGATIIHTRYLISAAHCFITANTNSSNLIRVVVGEHDFSTVYETMYTRYHDITAITLHERFRATASLVRNDIALLRTRTPMEWNRSVGPACLPFYTLILTQGTRRPPVAGQVVVTAGWGTTSFGGPQSTRLLKTTLDVIATQRCRRALGTVPNATFCTFTPGTDTCQYDSGGALYARRKERLFAVGVVSYGFACASQKPSVNTRVAQYVKWITQQTPKVEYCKK